MKTATKFFSSCFLCCLALTFLSGCGGGGLFTETLPALTPAEQAEVDRYIREYGRDAIPFYLQGIGYNKGIDRMREGDSRGLDEKFVLKYLKHFIHRGADIHARDRLRTGGETALLSATRNGHLEIVKFLISKGADVHEYGTGLLHTAVGEGNLDTLKYLESKVESVDMTDLLRSAVAGSRDSETGEG